MVGMKYLRNTLWIALLALSFGSCDNTIHEYPDESQISQGLTIYVNLKSAITSFYNIPQYKDTTFTRTNLYTQDEHVSTPAYTRYTINIYRPDKMNPGMMSKTPSYHYEFFRDGKNLKPIAITTDVIPGKFNVRAWVDYTYSKDPADAFYDATDFEEVKLQHTPGGLYPGNTDWRDAFCGSSDCEMKEMQSTEVDIDMSRPMAKFRFVTIDLEDFIEDEIKLLAKEEAKQTAAKKNIQNIDSCANEWTEYADLSTKKRIATEMTDVVNGRTDSKTDSKTNIRGININNYKVYILYPLYVNYSFNLYQDRPADAWAGQQFEGRIIQLNDAEAEMGFDYMFVNTGNQYVQAQVVVYNKDNTCLAASDLMTIPIQRGKITTVRGKFLTSKAKNGIHINPSFDGEFNIEIH